MFYAKKKYRQNLSNKRNLFDNACIVYFIISPLQGLLVGNVVSTAEAEDVYREICAANGMENVSIFKRRAIK